ncbi:staphylopine uptake ABC transporter ATP-binding protein CntD [Staphylococcus edaphicus]|uniref:ABC transporter ATP-binding protein n=1 Tax=Staphylococcus edaphicus TaxID=1955013 RepID=A0A2C6WPX4_9STAP|nr:ABC transporter ATP-binding protein [Staphylococcus edaphicus]PHK50135.1 nickel import ATP-binding protein NikD [Staphylococcus edaphicus]UQW81633.1 ABC transporter ATP-binding protein [Staphylococcus edaphicus]
MSLLTIKQLYITDSHTNQPLVSDINFQIKKGETLGIIGESGSGKTITCRAITGLNDSRLKVEGHIYFDGIDLLKVSEQSLREQRGGEIAMIMQQGSRAFDPSTKVRKQMFETMRAHTKLSLKEIEAVLLKYMDFMNLKQPKKIMQSYPFMLSGGMLQRLMIVLALALKPKLIIADEPTTALDTITQYEVLEAFRNIKKEFDCAMIFISHDLAVINQVADSVLVMKAGQCIETGLKETVLYQPEHTYTKYLISTKQKINQHFKKTMRGELHA